jgi:hypothetical protein
VIPWRIDSGCAIMEIFNLGSLGDELPRARLALLLERFSELSDNREPQRIMYPLDEVFLLVSHDRLLR